MRADDHLLVTGELVIELFDENGALKDRRCIPNLVVTAGKNVIADRMKAAPGKAAMTHMAVGTGATAAAAGDTTLQTELARVALAGTVVTANQIQYSATYAAGVATGALTEAGIFNNVAGGDMLNRVVFGVNTKAAGDSLTITWTVTIN